MTAPHVEHIGGAVIISAGPPVDLSAVRSVTPAQALVALYALKGITEQDLDDAVAGIEDDGDRYTAQIALKRATEWRRQSPTTQTVAQLLGLSDDDLDDLFAHAETVEV
jgi:hypothetical protein